MVLFILEPDTASEQLTDNELKEWNCKHLNALLNQCVWQDLICLKIIVKLGYRDVNQSLTRMATTPIHIAAQPWRRLSRRFQASCMTVGGKMPM